MSDEELRAVWRAHLAEKTWESFERWARAAARSGNPDGLELVLAARRWDRQVKRAEKLSVLRRSEHPREVHVVESALGHSLRIYRRARSAARGLERDGLLPHAGDGNHPGRGILSHLATIRGQEVRDRASHKRRLAELHQEALDEAEEAAREARSRAQRRVLGPLEADLRELTLGDLNPIPDPIEEWNVAERCAACGHPDHGDPCGRAVRPTNINPDRRCACRG